MRLIEHTYSASSVALGDATRWDGRGLTIAPGSLAALFPDTQGLRLDSVYAVAPGSSARIGPVLDVTQIRFCAEGSAFPGVTGPIPAGDVRTLSLLDNAGVCLVSNLPGVQEGVIDMASAWSPLSALHLLVCAVRVAPGVDSALADSAMRLFIYRAGEFLGALLAGSPGADTREWRLPAGETPSLPTVGAVYFIQSQGLLRATRYYGEAADNLAPTFIDPLSPLCGCITSGNYVMPSNKTCTLIHQKAPVIRALLERHGKDWNLGGVLLANEPSAREEKERTAEKLARMARERGLDGVIINQEGGGNADMDVMLACAALEAEGIATVLIVNEMAGPDGRTPSLTATTPEARCIISAGNNEMPVSLPRVDAFYGYPMSILEEDGGKAQARLALTRLYASTNQLGFGRYSGLAR